MLLAARACSRVNLKKTPHYSAMFEKSPLFLKSQKSNNIASVVAISTNARV
jgi:hypothetical protein